MSSGFRKLFEEMKQAKEAAGELELAKIQLEHSLQMQKAQMAGLSGQNIGQLGALQNAQNQYAAMQGYQAAAQAQLGAQGLNNAFPASPATPYRSPHLNDLQEVIDMLGINFEAEDSNWGKALSAVMKEIVLRTGIQRPMKKDSDMIDAIMDTQEKA